MSLAAYASETKESLVPLVALVVQVVKTIENVVWATIWGPETGYVLRILVKIACYRLLSIVIDFQSIITDKLFFQSLRFPSISDINR